MRTIFVGDIHGCATEFSAVLARVEFDVKADRLLLTGDAFSKGPDPIGVWNQIQDTKAEMVLGNHGARLMEQLSSQIQGKSPKINNRDQQRILETLLPSAKPLLGWLESLPLFIADSGFLLVHAGINPEKGLAGTKRNEFLAIRTWPPLGGIEGPRWHDHLKPLDRILLFGHDAPGGLVEKRREDGSAWLIGLDSGCVYGKALSAYILEEDRIVQV